MKQTATMEDEWTGKELLSKIMEVPNENNPYLYHRLGSDNEIRLVTIKPGKWTDPITCELSCHSLDVEDETEYWTLSYAWGSPRVTENVILESRPWPITVNLANALLFLRDREKPVRMWIDALCIDQSNLKERGKQVQLMKDIYSGGTQVIVYLGDGKNHRPKRLAEQWICSKPPARIEFHNDERDEIHLESFWDALSASAVPSFPAEMENRRQRIKPRPLSSTFHMFCLLRILSNEALTSHLVDRMRNFSDPSFEPLGTLIENLRRMLLNPWWQRIWVVQEMIVSRVAVVRCGQVTCPWEMFISAASRIFCPSFEMPALFRPDSVKVLQYFSRQVLSFRDLRNEWQNNHGAPMLTLLQDFSARRATDERDKVFALLGLSLHSQRFLTLTSYEDTVAEVYRSTALEIIRRSRSLDIWRGDMARKNRRDLDSWVPDWSSVYDEADRRRARVTYDHNPGLGSTWKLTVVKSEGEYWKFVVEGMVLLSHWLQQNPNKKLPSRLQQLLLDYGANLAACSNLYDDSSSTAYTKTVDRIRKLCSELARYCTSDDFGSTVSQVPLMHLFGRSAALYRGTRDQRSRSMPESQNDPPFSDVFHNWLYSTKIVDSCMSSWPELRFVEELMAPCKKHKPECGNAGYLSHRPFLSLESVTRGTVKRVGRRLLSWDDRHSAFETISRWITDYLPLVGNDKLRMANTLVGGGSSMQVFKDWAKSSISDDVRKRLRDEMLLEWFDDILKHKNFQGGPTINDLDEALVLCTGGRVLFVLDDGTLGLGPGSIAVGDSVNILPGGRSPIVLRSADPSKPAYKVIGDCFLELFISDLQKNWLPEFWPGWLPESIMRGLNDLWYSHIFNKASKESETVEKRKRIYLF